MQRKSFAHILVCLPMAALLTAAGCQSDPEELPLSHSQAALSAETNVKNITDNLAASTGFLAESDAIAETLSSMSDCDESSGDTGEPAVLCDPSLDADCDVAAPAPPVLSECGPDAMKRDLREFNQEIDESLSKFVTKLKQEIFIEANIESRTENQIVYRLPASAVCDLMDDAECLMEHVTAEPRLKVTSPSEGNLDVAVLLTAKKLQPMVFRLYRDKLAVSMDLAALRAAMAEIEPAEAEELVKLAGAVSVSLVKNRDRDFSLLASVDEDIDATTLEEGKPTEIHLDASSKTYEVRLDGNAKSITAAMNMGMLSAKMPLENLGDIVDATPNANTMQMTDVFNMVLGGLNGSITFNGTSDVLALKGLGLGSRSTSFSVNGNEIIGLDVNKNQKRRFDMTVTGAKTERPSFSFAPGLEVELRLKFQSIADRFRDIPNTVLDETLTMKLSGTNPTIREGANGMEVVSGTLSLTSAAKPATNVTVASGMCLIGVSDAPPSVEPATEPAAEEELLSSWKAGSCQ